MDDGRRLSCSSIGSSRRTSLCSSRIAEIPVENFVQHSKVETLQWQLKEIEKSREMYKAVMKQVVTFLEKTHKSLELLGTRLNPKQTVPRSKSEHQIVTEETGVNTSFSNKDDCSPYRDLTWRRPKKQELSSEEIPPEKLSQEAFRLLRTAQSLLNTEEPKLVTSTSEEPEDMEFLAQLAKEFPPPVVETKPQRTTSFSLSPKLLTPDNETKISTAFNRKLSLQLNEVRKSPFRESLKLNQSIDSSRLSVMENGNGFLSSTVNDYVKEHRFNEKSKYKSESEKSNSPPAGSISSVEDESGFSSMNSFQDVGLPLVADEVSAKSALLRSMLHNNPEEFTSDNTDKDIKLWQKPSDVVSHKRWSSTPANNNCHEVKQSMNVLWV